MTSLDDLLEFEEEQQRPPRRQRRRNWLTVALVASLVLTAVLYVGLRIAFQLHVPVILIFTFVFCCAALRRVLGSIRTARPLPTSVPGHDGTQFDWDTPDGLYTASGRWNNRVSAASRDAQRFEAIVIPPLAELVEQRLRLRHGVDWNTEPARARKLLGEQLWAFLHGEVRRSPSPRDLAEIVTRLEAL